MTQAKNPGRVLPLMGSMVIAFLLFLSTVPAISATFTDTFDDPAFTSSNWMDFPTGADQTWRLPALSAGDTGYHATTAAPGSACGGIRRNHIHRHGRHVCRQPEWTAFMAVPCG